MIPVRTRKVWRKIDGFLLYDKPKGVGSTGALQHVRRLYQAERAGHTGTLDPLASGLMIVCFGQATRFAGELLASQKTYLANIRLGVRTSTGDGEGSIIESHPVDVTAIDIESATNGFKGEILQTPPMHSALKRDGIPLYRLARKGLDVPRTPRSVTIYAIQVESTRLPEVTIRVTCSKGTYIRVLAEDIGKALGCGAHLSDLVRLKMGPFHLEDALTNEVLDSLSDEERHKRLRPAEGLAYSYPPIHLDKLLANKFCQGQEVFTGGAFFGECRVYDDQARFLGTGVSSGSGILQPKRVLCSGFAN